VASIKKHFSPSPYRPGVVDAYLTNTARPGVGVSKRVTFLEIFSPAIYRASVSNYAMILDKGGMIYPRQIIKPRKCCDRCGILKKIETPRDISLVDKKMRICRDRWGAYKKTFCERVHPARYKYDGITIDRWLYRSFTPQALHGFLERKNGS